MYVKEDGSSLLEEVEAETVAGGDGVEGDGGDGVKGEGVEGDGGEGVEGDGDGVEGGDGDGVEGDGGDGGRCDLVEHQSSQSMDTLS